MDLASLLPAGGLGAVGAGGLLATVIIYLLTSNRTDRREYQEAIDRAEKRADAAEERAEARLATLRARVEQLQRELEEARIARHAAEDRAAEAERQRFRARGKDRPA